MTDGQRCQVVVIGAGQAELAAAACLRRRGIGGVIAATGYRSGLEPLEGHRAAARRSR